MEAPDFWDDAEKASADMKELKDLKSIVERAMLSAWRMTIL